MHEYMVHEWKFSELLYICSVFQLFHFLWLNFYGRCFCSIFNKICFIRNWQLCQHQMSTGFEMESLRVEKTSQIINSSHHHVHHQTISPSATPRWFLNSSRDSDSTTSLGSEELELLLGVFPIQSGIHALRRCSSKQEEIGALSHHFQFHLVVALS